ncbi:extracellular solute-binding protein [Pseudomonas sp. 5P_3.1_Bac2]|uniref:extracellular solute-binding protein n=1 Tax=Pseudomonas sp. 5P_3.1_Bac2 TaxID=2971617 RepID=UPI0021C6F994|nr:extracellular solute-binding protein [Pseudomonas sp. 5P_3.1_Bac2]MCU1718063.1 extracellular solute-binding protein [Pseudomonas sp. 5P_3.1_Bac2]
MLRQLCPLLLALAPLLSSAEEVIRVYNWNDYINPQVLTDFTAKTGIRIDYQTFSTSEELEAALSRGDAIDVTVAQHNSLPQMIGKGQLQTLDFNKLPNRSHLDRQLLSTLIALDPGNQHALPYLWGAVGLAINKPQAEAAFGGPLPNSWSLLFDREQSSRLASCGISVLDAPDETLSILLNYQGYNLARSASNRIKRSAQLLQGLRPNLRYVDSERYIDDLNQGKLCVAMAWVGDALAAANAGQPVEFSVPEEGSVVFIDSLVIPSSATRPDLAYQFINYVMQPEVAALTTNYTLYPSGNADAKQFLDENLRNQPLLYPDRTIKRRLHPVEALPEKQRATRESVWTSFRDAS